MEKLSPPPQEKSDQLGEFELIKKHLAPLAENSFSIGLTDDAAIFQPPPNRELVLTKDLLLAGVHFFPTDPPELIARKALRINLSDLAAMGSDPVGYLLGLGLPADWNEAWLEAFCEGLRVDQNHYGIELFGGDTIRSTNGLLVSITMIGSVPVGQGKRRSAAQPDDLIYVTGTLGDSALGLALRRGELPELEGDDKNFLQDRYLLPQPRVEAVELVRSFATASIDISDGLIADLGHMCASSGIGARLEASRIPISDAVRKVVELDATRFEDVMSGGDDYEVLLSVARRTVPELERAAAKIGVKIQEIGYFCEQEEIKIGNLDGTIRNVSRKGYAHF